MHRGLFREPIHLNIANRGKLRKIQHHKIQLNQLQQDLLLTPNTILTDNKIQKKNYHQTYFKKQQENRNKEFFNNIQSLPNEQASGSFRAIHTAAYPNQSLRGFPLRSITAIKPFRRGIRSSHKYSKNTVELTIAKQEQIIKKIKKLEPAEIKLEELMTFQSPQYVFRYNQNAQYQQFYKYKEKKTIEPQEAKRQIAGTKIEPFKKYHIRQINKDSYTQRIHHYQMIFNQ